MRILKQDPENLLKESEEKLQKVKQQSKMREDKLKQEMQNIMAKAKEELKGMLSSVVQLEQVKIINK